MDVGDAAANNSASMELAIVRRSEKKTMERARVREFTPMTDVMRWADGFIAVDWGTTNRRAYRLDRGGHCRDEFEDDKGVLSIAEGGFPAAVAEIRKRLGDHPLLLAGMIGSNRGWQ